MRVGIVGGGPCGLALAHALLTLPGPQKISSVSVYDRDGILDAGVGGGLQLSCGAATLKRLGVDVSTVGTPIRSVLSRRPDGGELLSLDVQQAMLEAGAPLIANEDATFAVMRSSLQRLRERLRCEPTSGLGAC